MLLFAGAETYRTQVHYTCWVDINGCLLAAFLWILLNSSVVQVPLSLQKGIKVLLKHIFTLWLFLENLTPLGIYPGPLTI